MASTSCLNILKRMQVQSDLCYCCLSLQVEGTCSPKHGYILAVLKVDEVTKVSTADGSLQTVSCADCVLCFAC